MSSRDNEPKEEPFVQRWSRRKAESGKPAAVGLDQMPEEGAAENAVTEEEPERVPAPSGTEAEQPDLPDIETLTAESDFSVFMQDGVPDEIRSLALRRLWRLDPVLANLDGLLDYGGDFTDAATVVDNLKTAYQVGRGFLGDEEENEEASEGVEEVALSVPPDEQPEEQSREQHDDGGLPEPVDQTDSDEGKP